MERVRDISWEEVLDHMGVYVGYNAVINYPIWLSVERPLYENNQFHKIWEQYEYAFGRIGVNLQLMEVEVIDPVVRPTGEYEGNIHSLRNNWTKESKMRKALVDGWYDDEGNPSEEYRFKQFIGQIVYLAEWIYDIIPGRHYAAGAEYGYGNGRSEIVVNVGLGGMPMRDGIMYDSSGVRKSAKTTSHEGGHSLSATHDNNIYDDGSDRGFKTLMYGVTFDPKAEDRNIFSAKSGNEVRSYIQMQEATNAYPAILNVNGGMGWVTKQGEIEDYEFSSPDGEIVDIQVLYHPYKRIDEVSLIKWIKESDRADLMVFEDGKVTLRDWEQRSKSGNYGYFAKVKLPNGEIVDSSPVVIRLGA
ncbi:MAG: hypothetical protein SVK08_00435 [Halobacteriota archaeon]|nr:hypothetical protein [Halobacteriota archaeon]